MTPSPEFAEVLKIATAYGLAFPLMVFAVRWLNRDRDKLLDSLNTERNERIHSLEAASERCASDRLQLHQEMRELQAEVRRLYDNMIRRGNCKECQSGDDAARERRESPSHKVH